MRLLIGVCLLFGLHFQKLCRKLVHISVGLVYFLMWPLFRYTRPSKFFFDWGVSLLLTIIRRCSADDVYAPFLASLAIALNIVRVTLVGLGIVKDHGVVSSMTRHGDHR